MNSRNVAIIITGLSITAGIVHYFSTPLGYGLEVFSLLIIITCIWWFNGQHVQVQKEHDALILHKINVEQKNNQLIEQIKEHDNLFHALEGMIYSKNLKTNTYTYINGTKQVFGFTDDEFYNAPNLWKTIIHPDDISTVEENEKQLSWGLPTKIEFRILISGQEEKWLQKTAKPYHHPDTGVEKVYGQIIDITERKQLELQLKQMAYFDELTDIANRKFLDHHFTKALARSKRHHHNLTIMFIDLDDFKIVNDTMGHEAGDLLLKEAVDRLKQNIRDEDVIARIGGDEFVVVFEETSKDEIEGIAQRILSSVSQPYLIHAQEARISLSIGISMYPDDGEDKQTLIEHADRAMYFAKNSGKNSYKLFTADLKEMDFKKKNFFEKWLDTIQKTIMFN